MRNKNKQERNLQELYYDGEGEYIDSDYVSPELKEGIEDCIKYLDGGKMDDDVLQLKQANSGKFYREPYKCEVKVTNTYVL